MPLPAVIAIGQAIIGIISSGAGVIEKANGLFSTPERSEELRKLDNLETEISELRYDLERIGKDILAAIAIEGEKTRMDILQSNIDSNFSLAQSALKQLYQSRTPDAQPGLKGFVDNNSQTAVDALYHIVNNHYNVVVSVDEHIAASIGKGLLLIAPFLYAVNVRLIVLVELQRNYLIDPKFRDEVASWVIFVRKVANEFENIIEIKNGVSEKRVFIDRTKECEFDEESRRIVCEMVNDSQVVIVSYKNISDTVNFHYQGNINEQGNIDNQEALDKARQDVQDARQRGKQSDLDLLGVTGMRQIATSWESTVWESTVKEPPIGIMIDNPLRDSRINPFDN